MNSQLILVYVLLTYLANCAVGSLFSWRNDDNTPVIRGGIGDGYIYPIKPPNLQHMPQVTNYVRTYKLIVEDNRRKYPQLHDLAQGSDESVTILKVIQTHGYHSQTTPLEGRGWTTTHHNEQANTQTQAYDLDLSAV